LIAMRQLTPLTNLVLACLAAVGLVASLGLPWYAPPDATQDPDVAYGHVEAIAAHIARTFSSDSTVSGSDILAGRSSLVPIVAGLVIVLCLAMLVPALRGALRDLLRAISLLSPLGVALLALRAPASQGLDTRWGLYASIAIAVFMASSAWHGSSARSPRAVAAPRARPVA
jgi:hypothetical protein